MSNLKGLLGVEPRYMGIGPVPAIRKVLELTGLKKEDVDVWEASIRTKTDFSTFLILHV